MFNVINNHNKVISAHATRKEAEQAARFENMASDVYTFYVVAA